MKKKYVINTHYLSISYKVIIKNRLVQFLLFLAEIYLLLLQIMEIFLNDFVSYRTNNIVSFSPLTKIIYAISKFPIGVNFFIYIMIIICLLVNYKILNSYKLKSNIFISITINISELLFYRLLSLLMFNYLFSFTNIFLLINLIITIPYILALLFHFKNNHLFLFFPSIVNYPFDSFSMIIDLYTLPIKIFLSISGRAFNKNISKFFFFLSIIILYILLFYLTFIMLYKSYYFMNNCTLNKVRYSTILTLCANVLFIIIIGKSEIYSLYCFFCYMNILIICTLFIGYFYNPYEFSKFDKDDNPQNVLYYFFILDRNKNDFLLLEQKIEQHLSNCNKCNLCKKYNNIKLNKKDEIDLYYIIFNGKNFTLNLMNNIIRGIRKNGKKSFIYNSYFLINAIYIYTQNINEQDYNSILNTELMYEVINSENEQFLEEHKICLDKIKYTNNFFIKAKNILEFLYEIFEEKKLEKKTEKFFKLGELLDDLKYKEIKSNVNNNTNNNGNANESLPNCSNLLTLCSLFYEELYNEPLSNSGVYIRETPNILEDLINNNIKNSRQITLEINIQQFQTKIIRAGGQMNKYENKNLFDLFPVIFKSRQIKQMKDLLLYSNNNLQNKLKERNKNHKYKKGVKNQKQYINFSLIIEEKEDMEIFYRKIKLKLSLIFLMNIDIKIYLNGIYTFDKDIIVTEQKKEEEIILNLGNKELNNIANNKKITIKSYKNEKYFGNKKLVKDSNCFIGCKRYNVYHFVSSNKKYILEKSSGRNIRFQTNDIKDDKSNLMDNSNKLMLFNDLASQASSTTSSISKNNFINYNRGNKQTKGDEDINKEFKLALYILIISILAFLLFIFVQYLLLKSKSDDIRNKSLFLLSLKDYTNTFHSLFFSILSLTCIGNSSESEFCLNEIEVISKIQMSFYVQEEYGENETIFDYLTDFDFSNIDEEEAFYLFLFSNLFVDFSELLFKQTSILSNKLESILSDLIKYLSYFNGNEFIKSFSQNITHYQIHQNLSDENNNIIFSVEPENLTFTDSLLLISSSCSILTKDIKNLNHSIYFLNIGGNDIFKNVYNKKRLNSYQENIYLLLLDNQNFFDRIYFLMEEIQVNIFFSHKHFKSLIYTFLIINIIFLMIIILILFGYIYLYFIIIFKVIRNIYFNLNKKIGNILVKDLIRKKMDNLKLILSYYEKDINSTINDLNGIYTEYSDNYNLKVKEDARQIRKEGKNELNQKDKKYNIFNFIKISKKYNLLQSSGRKSIYLYGLLFIIIISLILAAVIFSIWAKYFNKDSNSGEWDIMCEGVIKTSNQLMTSFLIMIFTNQTINELSNRFENKDFLFYIYNKLTKLYNTGKYLEEMSDLLITTEKSIKYDCTDFFKNLNNDVFKELHKYFEKREDEFYLTIGFFCYSSNIMTFKNYKTIYLQLFNKVKNVIEKFSNKNYSDIIQFFNKNQIVEIETIFLIVYYYLLSLMFENTQHSIRSLMKIEKNNIKTSGIIYISMIILLIINVIFIYVRNVNKDTKRFIHIRKVFKICNINE